LRAILINLKALVCNGYLLIYAIAGDRENAVFSFPWHSNGNSVADARNGQTPDDNEVLGFRRPNAGVVGSGLRR
jgi:hypothetical protein